MQAILPNGQITDMTGTLSKLSEHNDLIQIETGENLITLRAFSKAIHLAVDIPAEVLEAGSTTVRASKFLACCGAQKLNVIKIDSNPSTATVSCESFRASLPVIDPGLFLPTPQLRDDHVVATAQADQLIHAFSVAQPCSMGTGMDLWEDSFYIETSDTVGVIVCSDRSHFASVQFQSAGGSFRCCIPQSTFLNCINLTREDITIKYTDNLVEFSSPGVRITSLLIAKMMPSIRTTLLPVRQQAVHRATFDAESLMTALNLASRLESDRPNYYAYIDLDSQACRLRCNGDRTDEVNADLQGTATRPAKIYFDHNRLLSSLRNLHRLKITSHHITIRYIDPMQPIFIDLDDQTDNFYAIMPKRPPTQEPE